MVKASVDVLKKIIDSSRLLITSIDTIDED